MGNQATTGKKRNKKELRRRRSFNPNSSKTAKQITNYDDEDNGEISYYQRREASPYAVQSSQVGFKQKSIMQSQVQARQLTGISSQFRNQIATERVGGTDGQKRLVQSKYREDSSPLTPNNMRNYHQSHQNYIRQLDQSRQNIYERGLAKKNVSKDDRSADFPRIKKDKSVNRNAEEREVYQLGRKEVNTERSNYENNQREIYHKKDEKTMNNYTYIYEQRGDKIGRDQSNNGLKKNQEYQQYGRDRTRYQNDRDNRQDIDRRNGRNATFDQLISGFQRKRESSVEEKDNVKQFERELLAEGNTNLEDDDDDEEVENNYEKEEQSNNLGQNFQKQEIEDLKNTSEFMAQYMLMSGAFSDYEWLTSTTMITFNQKLLQPPNKKEGVMAQTFGPEGEPDSDLGRYLLYVRDLEQSSIMDIDFIHLVESQKKKKKKKKNLINIKQSQDQDIHNYLQSNVYLPDRELANIIQQQYLEEQRKSQVARKETGRFFQGEESGKNMYAQEGKKRNRDIVDEEQRNTNNRKNKTLEERVSPKVQNANQIAFQRRDVMRDRSEDKKDYASDPFPRNILTQGEFSNVSSIQMNASEIEQFDESTPKNTKNYIEEKEKYNKEISRKNEGEQHVDRKKNELMANQTNQRKGGGGYNQKIEKHNIERQKSRNSSHNNSSSASSSDHSRKQTPRETAEFVQIFQEEGTEKRKIIKKVNKNENSLFADIRKLKEEEEIRDEAKRRAQIQYDQEHKKQEIQDMLLVSASQYNKKNKFPESNFQAYRIQQQEIEELTEQHFQELKKQKFIRERADLYSNSTMAQHQRNALQKKYGEEQKISDERYKSNSRERRDKDGKGKKSQKSIKQQEEQRIKQQQEYEEKWKMFDVKMKERDSKRKTTYQKEESPSQNTETNEDQDTLELRQRLIERKQKVLEKTKEKQPQQVNRNSVYTSNFYQNNEKDIVSMIMSNNGFIQPHKDAESSSDNESDDDVKNEKYAQKPIKIDLKSFLKDKEEKRLMQQQQWQTSDKKLQKTEKKNEKQTPKKDKQNKQERRKSSSSDSSEADSMLNSISHQVDSLKGRIQKDKNTGLLELAASSNAQIPLNTKQSQGYSPGSIKQQKEQSLQSMQDQLFSRQSPVPTKKNPMIIIQPTQKTQNKQQTDQEIQSKLEQQQFTQGLFVKAVSEYGEDSSTSIQQKTIKPQSNSSSADSSKKNILPAQDNLDITSTSSISISQQLRERKNEFLKQQIQQQQQQQSQKPSSSVGQQVSPPQSLTQNQQAQQQPQYSAKTEQQQQPQSRKQSNQNESGIIVISSKHSSTQSHRNSQLFSNKPAAAMPSTGNKYPQQEQVQQQQITVNPPPQTNQNENSLSESGSLSGKRLSELGHPSQPRYSFLDSGKQSEKEQQSVNYAKQNQIEINQQKQQTSYNSVSSASSSLKQQQPKYQQQQEQIQQQGFQQQQQQQQQQQTLKQPPSLASLGVRQANSSVVTSEESIMKDNLSPKQNEQQQFKGNPQGQQQQLDEMSHSLSQEVMKQNVQTAEEDKEQQSSSSMQSSKSSKSKNQSDPSSLNNSGGIDFFGKPQSNPRSSEEVDFFGKDSSNNIDDHQDDTHGRDQSHSDNSDDEEYKEMSKITEKQKVLPHSGFDFGAFGDSSQQHSQNEEEEDAPAKIQINMNNYKRK